MMVKRALSSIVEVVEDFDIDLFAYHLQSRKRPVDRLLKSASFEPIRLDPVRYLYYRNRSIDAEETWGPNQNFDAFPRSELSKRYSTFVGVNITVDHDERLVVGTVLDSVWIPLTTEPSLDGDYVENFHAIDKKLAEKVDPNLVPGILSGEIKDSSMGVFCNYSVCSVCGHKAYDESDFCDHIRYHKGSKVVATDGSEKTAYERCYGLTFFEDTIVRPLHLGGTAGGRGACPNCKILEFYGSVSDPVEAGVKAFLKEVGISWKE